MQKEDVYSYKEFLGVMHKHNYLCVCGTKSQMTLNNFFKGKNCKKCGSKKHEYTLEEVREIFAKENAKLISKEYKGYKSEIEFICSCGREGKRTFEQFRKSKNCEACGYESTAYTIEELQEMFASKGFKLLENEVKGVVHRYRCICHCGRETNKSWRSLKNGKGCRQCQIDNSKFSYEEAREIFRNSGWLLLDNFYFNNNYLHNAICKCGNITKKRLSDLKRYPGCLKCTKKYIPTIEELKKEFIENNCILLEDNYVNSHTPMKYICKCGNQSEINLNNWRNGKRCKICGDAIVFDMKLPSNVYLLRREGQYKIGKNNRKSLRLVTHKNNGWEVIDKIGPIIGRDASEIEKTIKYLLKKNGVPTGKNAFGYKFDGSSECWSANDLFVTSLNDLWNKL